MNNVLNGSVIYRFLTRIYHWLQAQWRQSALISRFLSDGAGSRAVPRSFFSRFGGFFHSVLCLIFDKSGLKRALEGSIFKKSYLWCLAALTLAPILPTVAVIALMAAMTLAHFLNLGCDTKFGRRRSTINTFILLFALTYFISTLTSYSFSGSLYGGLLITFFMFAAIFVQNAVTNRRQLDLLLVLFVAAGALVSLYGLYQYFTGAENAKAWVDSGMFDTVTRVYGTLQNPNVFAEYLLLVIPFAMAFVVTGRTIMHKFFALAALGIMLVAIVMSYSRGGWLGLILAIAVFLVLIDRRFIILGILALIALYFVLPESIVSRFTSIGNLSDGSTSYRLYIWMGTLAMLRHYWFSGIGPGEAAFSKIYPTYAYNAVTAPHSHNIILQITCDTGIIGTLLFVGILFLFFRTTSRALSRERDKNSRIYLIAAISAAAGWFLQGLTDYSFYNYRVTFIFFMFIGVGLLLAQRSKMPEEGKLW